MPDLDRVGVRAALDDYEFPAQCDAGNVRLRSPRSALAEMKAARQGLLALEQVIAEA